MEFFISRQAPKSKGHVEWNGKEDQANPLASEKRHSMQGCVEAVLAEETSPRREDSIEMSNSGRKWWAVLTWGSAAQREKYNLYSIQLSFVNLRTMSSS